MPLSAFTRTLCSSLLPVTGQDSSSPMNIRPSLKKSLRYSRTRYATLSRLWHAQPGWYHITHTITRWNQSSMTDRKGDCTLCQSVDYDRCSCWLFLCCNSISSGPMHTARISLKLYIVQWMQSRLPSWGPEQLPRQAEIGCAIKSRYVAT
nr:hypothetical protein CFP56_28480 [Quercus suber]